ncbi:hypothetical protein SARC_04619 [Sphaeroforma arctica JP610]|uniref:SSD domain-containing protein n=1 Tax=Sphaeroforma arctica JP610 TaxID=667725 RepID=A0A0L0G2T6_9EUKA|nr:hypothetical protein SARC_04619 [Sphaeroforma arctica JP610]KNC83121.1 hypothetical protein SARC_04619 [Sphaeroforma arctica JP610]|eukprot:XP_014157023.1 hypothetical protein SARC_04619 [Sphaeroforma arctica JP610]
MQAPPPQFTYTPLLSHTHTTATRLPQYYHDWQHVIDVFNDNSHSDAVMTQSAEAWGDAITQVTTVSGVGWSLSISALVAGLALLLFTQSPTLALTATALLGAVVLVVLGLAWCFGWEVGMVEALTLTMLMGLAVDYFIHLSEEYIENSRDNAPHDRSATGKGALFTCNLIPLA